MGDWEIEVDLMTKNIEDAFNRQSLGGVPSTGGAGADTEQTENTLAGGFSKGLKFAGVIGFLSQIKVVTDSIGFILGGLSSLISFFIVSFIQNVVPFFQDPVRALLELGVWIVNGIISGIEFLANSIIPKSLQPEGGFDFGRIDAQEVLAEYDLAKEAIKEMVGGIFSANDEMNEIKPAITGLKEKVDGTVNALGDALDYIANQADRVSGSGGSSFIFSGQQGPLTQYQTSSLAAKQSLDPVVELKRQNANKILKYLG